MNLNIVQVRPRSSQGIEWKPDRRVRLLLVQMYGWCADEGWPR